MNDIWIMFAIIVAIVVLFAWDRLPVVIVALGTALALYATGVLDLGQALAGLGDQAVIFIASLFVVSAGLDATGVTAWAGQFLIARAGNSRVRLMVVMLLLRMKHKGLLWRHGTHRRLLWWLISVKGRGYRNKPLLLLRWWRLMILLLMLLIMIWRRIMLLFW